MMDRILIGESYNSTNNCLIEYHRLVTIDETMYLIQTGLTVNNLLIQQTFKVI